MRLADSQAQIDRMSWRVLRRLQAAGVTSLAREDIVSELTIAWCIARDGYDPQYGAAFATYLHRGMLMHINRVVAREIGQRGMMAFSLDMSADDDDETPGLHEVIADESPCPHSLLEEAEIRRLAGETLSPDTLRFVELLENPIVELREAVQAARHRASYARSRGLNAVAPRDVTASMVFDFLGLDRSGRETINRELKKFSLEASQK